MTGGGDPQNHSRWKISLNENHFLVGRLSEGDNNEILADVYSHRPSDETLALLFNDEGYTTGSGPLSEQWKELILNAIQNSWGLNVSECTYATGVISIHETLPDWDTYELIS